MCLCVCVFVREREKGPIAATLSTHCCAMGLNMSYTNKLVFITINTSLVRYLVVLSVRYCLWVCVCACVFVHIC